MRFLNDILAPTPLELEELGEQKIAALTYLHEAWEEARLDGVETEFLAQAALFTALSELVKTYGEDAVVQLAKSLPRRIQHGDFTVERTRQ